MTREPRHSLELPPNLVAALAALAASEDSSINRLVVLLLNEALDRRLQAR
jgi:hypothetical protein